MFLVFKPSAPITVNTSLRSGPGTIKATRTYSIFRAITDKVDMPQIVNNGSSERQSWADLNFTGELIEFGIQDGTGAAARLMAIEIDGKILVDGGILNLAQTAFPHALYWVKRRDAANQHQLVMSSDCRFNNCVRTPDNTYQAYQDPNDADCVAWRWRLHQLHQRLFNGWKH